MRLKQQLLLVADAYCVGVGLSESRVSFLMLGDGGRLKRLRGGADARSGTIEDGLQWLSDRWPQGAVWPPQVPRPAPQPLGSDTPAA